MSGITFLHHEETFGNDIMQRGNLMTTITSFTCVRDGVHFIDAWFENVKQADQIVIQDGGSTDGTIERLLELRKTHPNVTLLLQTESNPKYEWVEEEVRNQCLSLFKCDFILLTDVDELIDDHFWKWAKETEHKKNGYYIPHRNLWLERDRFNIQPKWYPDLTMRFFRNRIGLIWLGIRHGSVWRTTEENFAQINPEDEDMSVVPEDMHIVHYHRAERGYYNAVMEDKTLHHSNEKKNLNEAPILIRLRKHPTG